MLLFFNGHIVLAHTFNFLLASGIMYSNYK